MCEEALSGSTQYVVDWRGSVIIDFQVSGRFWGEPEYLHDPKLSPRYNYKEDWKTSKNKLMAQTEKLGRNTALLVIRLIYLAERNRQYHGATQGGHSIPTNISEESSPQWDHKRNWTQYRRRNDQVQGKLGVRAGGETPFLQALVSQR